MPAVLDVRPSGFADAAHVVGSTIADGILAVWEELEAGLEASPGMAGSDEVGLDWGDAYDAAALGVRRATQDVCNACYQLAALLEQSGANYAVAEQSSMPGVEPAMAAALWAGMRVTLAELSPSTGAGTPFPSGWSLVQHAVGHLWPNGHQDRLRSAAAAWRRAAGRLDELLPVIGNAAREVLLQRAPESEDAFTVVDAMTAHVGDLADDYRQVAASGESYAAHLDEAHHRIIDELKSFLEWTAGIELAGGFCAIFTLGLSEAAAQAAEAAELWRAANAIRSAIEVLQVVARDERVAMEVAGADAVAITEKVAPVLAREVETARFEPAREVATMGERNLAVAATAEESAIANLESPAANIVGLNVRELEASAREMDRNGLTRAGRSLQKHGDRPDSAFPRSTGNAAARNQQGIREVNAVLRDPGRRVEVLDRVINIYRADGSGVRFSSTGVFKGFLEP